MNRRRILLIDLNGTFGGIETYVKEVSSFLQEEADVFVICVNLQLAESLQSKNVSLFAITFALHWSKPVQMAICLAMIIYLRVWHNIDTVWVNGYSEIVLLPCSRIIGCTAIATRHLTFDFEELRGIRAWKRRAAHYLYCGLAPTANKIICVSNAVAADICRVVSPQKIVVVPNWVSFLPEFEQNKKLNDGTFRILFAGRLERHKGVALIIESMRSLGIPNAHLVIVGGGECRHELERQAEGLNVKFYGFQKDMAKYYRGANLFINPTLGPEGLPIVSLEAMSHGLPCIFSDIPVHKEITQNGKCALLFRSGDPVDLCAKIKMLVSSPQLSAQYGQLGRVAVANKYSVEIARSRYIAGLSLQRGVR